MIGFMIVTMLIPIIAGVYRTESSLPSVGLMMDTMLITSLQPLREFTEQRQRRIMIVTKVIPTIASVYRAEPPPAYDGLHDGHHVPFDVDQQHCHHRHDGPHCRGHHVRTLQKGGSQFLSIF